MAKVQKETTFLVSTAGTGYFYTSRRNKKKIKGENKVNKKKYDPIARKFVLFEEKTKLSKLKVKKSASAKSESAAASAPQGKAA